MPSFQYRAYDLAGDLAEGRIEAASNEAAETMLVSQGLTPFKLRATSATDVPWWRRDLFTSGGMSRAQLASFTREFSELCSSGIPLDDCLRILSDQTATDKMRAISIGLLGSVLDGSGLASAMQKYSAEFPADYISVVQAGEISGTLGQALQELADLVERRASLDAKIRSALTYPMILLGLAAVSIGVVVGVLVPSITPIFEQNGKLPPPALRALILARENGGSVLLGLFGAACLIAAWSAYVRRSPTRRLQFDRLKLRLPIIGQFILQGEAARFARTLGTLLRAGVPLLQASASAQAVIKNSLISAKVGQWVGLLREGSSLSNALSGQGAFPPVAIRMILVGEEAGKLDKMLLRAALMFEGQTQRSIDGFMTLLTPILTVAIAALIGGLVLAVMNAILSVNELATG